MNELKPGDIRVWDGDTYLVYLDVYDGNKLKLLWLDPGKGLESSKHLPSWEHKFLCNIQKIFTKLWEDHRND